jgi:hypothetical protein
VAVVSTYDARPFAGSYELNSQHDLSQLLGGLGISDLLLVGGLWLVKKARQ